MMYNKFSRIQKILVGAPSPLQTAYTIKNNFTDICSLCGFNVYKECEILTYSSHCPLKLPSGDTFRASVNTETLKSMRTIHPKAFI